MKVFLDVLTPKQGMLFSKLSERLQTEGDQVFVATREYREAVQMLDLKRMKAMVIGKHGGDTLQGKLKASVERTLELISILKDLQPDVAVTFSSPETARVAFGLSIPHICINDSPHAESVARLTIPLATLLLTPKIIPKTAWTKFGISSDRIVQYNALDAWAWLRNFRPNEDVLYDLGLEKSRPIIAFRTEESAAAYLLEKASRTPIIVPLIDNLLESGADFQAVAIPRYESQIALLRQTFKKDVIVCDNLIDGPSLLSFASIFVGAGGTMTTEAALLGIPSYSCYPGKPYLIEKYLIAEKLVVRETHLRKLEAGVLKTLRSIVTAKRVQAEKARRVTRGFEDPINVIVRAIHRVIQESS